MRRAFLLTVLALSLAACSDASPAGPERATPSGPAFNHPSNLAASISGEDHIVAPEGTWDYHTWTAVVSGGTAPYSYDWAVDYDEVGGGFGPTGVTTNSYTQGADPRDGNFTVRVKVTDAHGHYVYAYMYVEVVTPENCFPELYC